MKTKDQLQKSLDTLNALEKKKARLAHLIEQYEPYESSEGAPMLSIKIYNHDGSRRCDDFWLNVDMPLIPMVGFLNQELQRIEGRIAHLNKKLGISE